MSPERSLLPVRIAIVLAGVGVSCSLVLLALTLAEPLLRGAAERGAEAGVEAALHPIRTGDVTALRHIPVPEYGLECFWYEGGTRGGLWCREVGP